MGDYRVYVTRIQQGHLDVVADSEEDAVDEAMVQFPDGFQLEWDDVDIDEVDVLE